jgi:glycosyltransferase involved in cell wall biosynthesis
MNCHNSGRYLREALDSVYQQTFKDYEIIFWDNLSTDSSAEIALSYAEPIRYFRGEEFLPLGAARNAAIEKASGKYIAFLDCDDIWLPYKLEKQLKLLDSNKELGLVYSDCYSIDSNGNLIGETNFRSQKPFRGNVFNELLVGNFISMPTAVIRRDVLNKVGTFSPKYEIVEEYDLWLRIAEHYPIDFTEEPLAKYRTHGGNVSRNQELSICESIQVVEYWLEKKGDIERQFRRKAKQEQAIRHAWLLLYYFRNHENRKTINNCLNLIKLLPYSLVLIPRGSAKLGRVLRKSTAKTAQI